MREAPKCRGPSDSIHFEAASDRTIAKATDRNSAWTRRSRRRASSSLSGAAVTGSVVAGLVAAGYPIRTIRLRGRSLAAAAMRRPFWRDRSQSPAPAEHVSGLPRKGAVWLSPIPRQNATRSGQLQSCRHIFEA